MKLGDKKLEFPEACVCVPQGEVGQRTAKCVLRIYLGSGVRNELP